MNEKKIMKEKETGGRGKNKKRKGTYEKEIVKEEKKERQNLFTGKIQLTSKMTEEYLIKLLDPFSALNIVKPASRILRLF